MLGLIRVTIAPSEGALGFSRATFCEISIPFGSFRVVFRHKPSSAATFPKKPLRPCISSLCTIPQTFYELINILWKLYLAVEETAQSVFLCLFHAGSPEKPLDAFSDVLRNTMSQKTEQAEEDLRELLAIFC